MTSQRFCLVVEDQVGNRDWLSGALSEAFGPLEVIHAASLREARAWMAEGRAAQLWLALVDLGLPDGSGIELIRDLRTASPKALIVVATIYDDDQHLFDALAAGAGGYLLKGEDGANLAHYLRRIEAGEPALSPSIARRLLGFFADPSRREAPDRDDARLTGRETETLTLLARGLTIAEVARTLKLQPQTVAGYVKVIYQKLNVSTRAEATLKAVRRGLA